MFPILAGFQQFSQESACPQRRFAAAPAVRTVQSIPSVPMHASPRPKKMAGRFVTRNCDGIHSVRVCGSSHQKQRMNAASPEAQSAFPSDVSGSQSARTKQDRNSSAASSSQTSAVGVTRCQLELFSMKRLSRHQ